jgi:hypothetical protein
VTRNKNENLLGINHSCIGSSTFIIGLGLDTFMPMPSSGFCNDNYREIQKNQICKYFHVKLGAFVCVCACVCVWRAHKKYAHKLCGKCIDGDGGKE